MLDHLNLTKMKQSGSCQQMIQTKAGLSDVQSAPV